MARTINEQVSEFLSNAGQFEGLNKRLAFESASQEARQRTAFALQGQEQGNRLGAMLVDRVLDRQDQERALGVELASAELKAESDYRTNYMNAQRDALEYDQRFGEQIYSRIGLDAADEQRHQELEQQISSVMQSESMGEFDRAEEVLRLRRQQMQIRPKLIRKTQEEIQQEQERRAAQSQDYTKLFKPLKDESGQTVGYVGPKELAFHPSKQQSTGLGDNKLLLKAHDMAIKTFEGLEGESTLDWSDEDGSALKLAKRRKAIMKSFALEHMSAQTGMSIDEIAAAQKKEKYQDTPEAQQSRAAAQPLMAEIVAQKIPSDFSDKESAGKVQRAFENILSDMGIVIQGQPTPQDLEKIKAIYLRLSPAERAMLDRARSLQ